MVDFEKYSGLWYEIFAIPFKWESGCEASTAEYQVVDNNTLSLRNTCYLQGSQFFARSGIAVVDPTSTFENDDVQQALVIEFTDGLPSDGVGSYWIHWTDYEYAVVGGPSDKFLWLLGRTPEILEEDLNSFVEYITDLGYDKSSLMLQNNVKVY